MEERNSIKIIVNDAYSFCCLFCCFGLVCNRWWWKNLFRRVCQSGGKTLDILKNFQFHKAIIISVARYRKVFFCRDIICTVFPSFQMSHFNWNSSLYFYRNKVWIWPVFVWMIKQYNMGFVNCQYALLSRLTFYKSRSGSSKGLSSTGIGVCFIKDLTFFVKSNSNVSLNLSIDMGRHECSLRWSENLS